MQVDDKLVEKIAGLARIQVQKDEVQALRGELEGILNWVEQLSEVDTDGVEPLTSVETTKMKMRDDVVTDGGYASDIVKNAPEQEDNFFVVPKVVD